MAIQVVSIPIAATMTETEIMIRDQYGTFKKRVEWAGEAEKAELLVMDELLTNGFAIVDVRETKANNFVWLRYTLHKPETPQTNQGERILAELNE